VKIGRFSFQALLFHIIGGLGLLQIATFVVDILALYVVGHSDHYTNIKYSVSKISFKEGKRIVKKKPMVLLKEEKRLKKDRKKQEQELQQGPTDQKEKNE